MKMNKTKLYYITLISILGVKIIMTIFQVGLSVNHGVKIAQLKLQKNNLMQEQLRLTTQLSQKSSLTKIIDDQDLTQYHGIGDTIVVTVNNEVALR